MPYYFPPPLVLACPGLVTDPLQQLVYANFTPVIPQAMHVSGQLQSASNTKLDAQDWYTSTFLPKIKQFRKGPLVWASKDLWNQAHDQDSPRYGPSLPRASRCRLFVLMPFLQITWCMGKRCLRFDGLCQYDYQPTRQHCGHVLGL